MANTSKRPNQGGSRKRPNQGGSHKQRESKPGANLPSQTRVPKRRMGDDEQQPSRGAKRSAEAESVARGGKPQAQQPSRGAKRPAEVTPTAKNGKPQAQPKKKASKRTTDIADEGISRLIIVGSPRAHGRSMNLADLFFEECIDANPADELALAPVSELHIGGCIGCGFCSRWKAPDDLDADSPEVQEAYASPYGFDLAPANGRCAVQDDMRDVYEFLDTCDELTVFSPVYFGGAPSQMKAVLDRLQPYFCARARRLGRGEGLVPKRPATLHVVGEGGDPYGFDALVTTVRSALACAGFKLETIFDWVGRIDDEGEPFAEADRYDLIDGEYVCTYEGTPVGEEAESDIVAEALAAVPDTADSTGAALAVDEVAADAGEASAPEEDDRDE